MSAIEYSLFTFDSYGAIEQLEAALGNPDDQALLYSLTRQNENHQQAGLSIIWAFAMTKGGAMEQEWHIGTPWQLHHTEDYPDGFFPDHAYKYLGSNLENENDQSLLRGFLEENVKMGRPEAALWAMWEFAMAKGEESTRTWRRYLDAVRQRELAGEKSQEEAPVFKRLMAKLIGSITALWRRRMG